MGLSCSKYVPEPAYPQTTLDTLMTDHPYTVQSLEKGTFSKAQISSRSGCGEKTHGVAS